MSEKEKEISQKRQLAGSMLVIIEVAQALINETLEINPGNAATLSTLYSRLELEYQAIIRDLNFTEHDKPIS